MMSLARASLFVASVGLSSAALAAKDIRLEAFEFKVSSPEMPLTRATLHVSCNKNEEESWVTLAIRETAKGEYQVSHAAPEALEIQKSKRCRLTLGLMNDNYLPDGDSKAKGVFAGTQSELRFEPFTVKELRKISLSKLIQDRFDESRVVADFKNGEVPALAGQALPKKFIVPELWIQRRPSKDMNLCDQIIPGIYEWAGEPIEGQRYVLVLQETRDMAGELIAELKSFGETGKDPQSFYAGVKSCDGKKGRVALKSIVDLEHPSTQIKPTRSFQGEYEATQATLKVGKGVWKRAEAAAK